MTINNVPDPNTRFYLSSKGNFLLLSDRFRGLYIPNKYLMTAEIKGTDYYLKGKDTLSRAEYNKFMLNLYDIHTGKIAHQIDLKAVLDKEGFQTRYDRADIYQGDKKKYISYIIEKKPKKPERYDKDSDKGAFYGYLHIDVDTLKVSIVKSDAEKSPPKTFDNARILGTGILKNNNPYKAKLERFFYKPMLYRISYEKDSPKNNQQLYTEFPILKQIENPKYFDVFLENPTGEEILNFTKEGDVPINYDGIVLKSIDATDYKEHVIHSDAEFNRWYRYSEQNYGKYKDK